MWRVSVRIPLSVLHCRRSNTTFCSSHQCGLQSKHERSLPLRRIPYRASRHFSHSFGLQVEQGPDAVVEYIEEHLPGLLEA
ncbi:hypothetical protein FKP32DRAFT_1710995 [Trametes sanguinea]|nr:hypothetical protein FKP32DRAFT_1710995 [Trametes sanguinea]